MGVITVACVLKSGGDFTPEHVYALKNALNEHLPEHRFYCFTDVDCMPVWMIPLIHDLPGWWSKMELCRPDEIPGTVLYIDLDTVILGDLSPLAFLSFT